MVEHCNGMGTKDLAGHRHPIGELIPGAAVAAVALALWSNAASAATCESLISLALPDTSITLAASRPAGPFDFAEPKPSFAPGDPVGQLPAFCRVAGTIAPAVKFEVWLPANGWNGKFQGVGNHVFAGSIVRADMAQQIILGYAVASTDTGHDEHDSPAWMANPEQLADYGYRAVHEMTTVGKRIVQAFYGTPAHRSYFNGCSTGGKQGLTEAQRYPDDYDGIVVGDPNGSQTRNRASYVWDAQATFAAPETTLSRSKLPLLHAAAVAACQGGDGIKDGIIEDPRRCHVDLKPLACTPGQAVETCFTEPQLGAIAKIYAGPTNPRTGERIYPGLPPGSELGWGSMVSGPSLFPTADQFYKIMIFANPNWDYRKLNFDQDVTFADDKVAGIINATDPDLRKAKAGGLKILHYQTWASTQHSAPWSIDYYERVIATLRHDGQSQAAASAEVGGFYRLFMVPEAGSCGIGDDRLEPLPMLDVWVEKGIAPTRLVIEKRHDGAVERSHPACPYPQSANWTGGDANAAANFACRPPAD